MTFSSATVTAVILAGGFGTRIKAQLPDLPKPLAPIGDRPFLDWQLRFLQQQGIQRVVLATGYLADKVAEYVQHSDLAPLDVVCVAEPEPLGTGGGFVHAIQHCPADIQSQTQAWLVLNGDSLIVTDYHPLIAVLENPQIQGALLGVMVEDAARFGTLRVDHDNNLTQFAEKRTGADVINSGVYLFRAETVDKFPQQLPLSFEYDVFPSLLQQAVPLRVAVVEAPFLDIGTPETLRQAEQFMKAYL